MSPIRSLLIPLFAALASTVSAPAEKGGITLKATVLPLYEFAKEILGERGRCELFLPPGAGVHTWQPRPGDLARLAVSDLVVWIGPGLEAWLPDLLASLPGSKRPRLFEAAAVPGIDLLAPEEDDEGHRGEHGSADPHIWLDFGADRTVVRRLADELSALDPAGREEYAARAEALEKKLDALDRRFREGLAECPHREILVAGHGAFRYLARRYGLSQLALYGLSPDAQPRPGELMRAVGLCRERGIRTIFTENSVPPDLARTLAREIGGRVLVLHSGHNLTRKQRQEGATFFDLMEENLRNLRSGLGCR